ncbi:MAG: hypothetical protein ACYCYI_03450 [Saccharofermentanales bacterium]
MKKVSALLVILSVLISILSIMPGYLVSAAGTTYYIDAQGNNSKDGISPGTAWVDFANINGKNLNAGDQILLKRGSKWVATNTYPLNLSESFFCSINGSGVTVDAYGTGADPVIDGNGFKGYAFHILNRDDMTFQNVTFKNISVFTENIYTTYNHSGLTLRNIYLDNGEIGIKNIAPDNTGGALIKNVVLDKIRSENNSSLFASNIVIKTRISGDTTIASAAANSAQNVFIHDVEMNGNQSGGIQLSNCNNVVFSGVKLYRSAVNQPETAKSAVLLYKTQNIKFFNCMITDNFTGSSVNQSAVNNEYATGYSIFKGCYIADNAAAGIRFLSSTNRPNDSGINHLVSNCTFVNNGQAKTETFGSLFKSNVSEANPEFSGNAKDNIFAEIVRPGSTNDGFTHSANGSDFKNWVFSNNVKIAVSDFVANSAKDFKGVYGISKWKYQTFNGVKWTDMAYSKTSGLYGNSKSNIGRFDILPDDNSSHWTARVYTAPYNGTAQIAGWAYMPYNNLGGNGADIKITLNGSIILNRSFSGTNSEGSSTNINNILLTKGDILRFEVNCGTNGSNNFDQVSWIPTVAYITANTTQSVAQSSSDDSQPAVSQPAVSQPGSKWEKSSPSAVSQPAVSQPGSNWETKSSSQVSVNSFHVNSTTVSEVPTPVKNSPISTIIILAILAIVIISGAVYARQAMKRDNSDEDQEDEF